MRLATIGFVVALAIVAAMAFAPRAAGPGGTLGDQMVSAYDHVATTQTYHLARCRDARNGATPVHTYIVTFADGTTLTCGGKP